MYIPKIFSSNSQIILVPKTQIIVSFIKFLSPRITLVKNKNSIEDNINPTGLKHNV